MALVNNLTTGQRVGAQTVDNFQVQVGSTTNLDVNGYSWEYYAGTSTGFNASVAFKTAGNTTAAPVAVGNNQTIGNVDAYGWNGTAYAYAASIDFQSAQAFSGTGNGTYIGVNITPIGGTSPAYYNVWAATGVYNYQPAPTALTATATLTIAQIQTQIIQVTSATAVTLTLPAGAAVDAAIISGSLPTQFGFDWYVTNLGSASGAITLASGVTGNTFSGNATVAIGTSAQLRTVKTATNTFTTYRII